MYVTYLKKTFKKVDIPRRQDMEQYCFSNISLPKRELGRE